MRQRGGIKTLKYANLVPTHLVVVETLWALGQQSLVFLKELGQRVRMAAEEHNLFQYFLCWWQRRGGIWHPLWDQWNSIRTWVTLNPILVSVGVYH